MSSKSTQQYQERHMLCLHGCNQTEEAFKSYMKQMVKIASQYNIQCHFVEAMYDHPLGGKTWFAKPLDLKDIGVQRFDDTDLKTEKTLDQIHEVVTKNNVSIILGFSQGGCVADTYIAYKNPNIKKLVVLSGYSFVDENRKNNDVAELLNVFSKSDEVVKSNLRPSHYSTISEISHDKGHKIPGSAEIRKILDFCADKC